MAARWAGRGTDDDEDIGTMSKGSMWLENTKGVYLRITTKRTGLALSLGVDGIVIEMEK